MSLQTSNAIVAKPPAVSTKRPRLMPRRRQRVRRADRPGICNWPESERPREKLLERGAQAVGRGAHRNPAGFRHQGLLGSRHGALIDR